jgi:hypothetical protein
MRLMRASVRQHPDQRLLRRRGRRQRVQLPPARPAVMRGVLTIAIDCCATISVGLDACRGLACHDLCPKELPPDTQIAFTRRKMVRLALK